MGHIVIHEHSSPPSHSGPISLNRWPVLSRVPNATATSVVNPHISERIFAASSLWYQLELMACAFHLIKILRSGDSSVKLV